MINADERYEVDDVIYRAYSQGNLDVFFQLCGFNIRDFDALYSLMSEILEVRKRGRWRTIGPLDHFLPLLHWLRTGASSVRIAISMRRSIVGSDPLLTVYGNRMWRHSLPRQRENRSQLTETSRNAVSWLIPLSNTGD
jgi:hypothetical protein